MKLARRPRTSSASTSRVTSLARCSLLRLLTSSPSTTYRSCSIAQSLLPAMASVEGGMEIEEVAETKPEALAKVLIDPLVGVDLDKAKEIVLEAKFLRNWSTKSPTYREAVGDLR